MHKKIERTNKQTKKCIYNENSDWQHQMTLKITRRLLRKKTPLHINENGLHRYQHHSHHSNRSDIQQQATPNKTKQNNEMREKNTITITTTKIVSR